MRPIDHGQGAMLAKLSVCLSRYLLNQDRLRGFPCMMSFNYSETGFGCHFAHGLTSSILNFMCYTAIMFHDI